MQSRSETKNTQHLIKLLKNTNRMGGQIAQFLDAKETALLKTCSKQIYGKVNLCYRMKWALAPCYYIWNKLYGVNEQDKIIGWCHPMALWERDDNFRRCWNDNKSKHNYNHCLATHSCCFCHAPYALMVQPIVATLGLSGCIVSGSCGFFAGSIKDCSRSCDDRQLHPVKLQTPKRQIMQ
jgi:hypothetical protein